jgi:hypothetical protein
LEILNIIFPDPRILHVAVPLLVKQQVVQGPAVVAENIFKIKKVREKEILS